jgi:hypothetical protein
MTATEADAYKVELKFEAKANKDAIELYKRAKEALEAELKKLTYCRIGF